MEEVVLFRWDEDTLKRSEVAISCQSNASSPTRIPIHQGGAQACASHSTFLHWRCLGNTVDLALVSLTDAPTPKQARFRVSCDVLAVQARFTKADEQVLLTLCTALGEVIQISSPFHGSIGSTCTSLVLPRLSPPTAACFAGELCWLGFGNGSIKVFDLGQRTWLAKCDTFEVKGSSNSSSGWLSSFLSKVEEAEEDARITHLLPSEQDGTFVMAVTQQGFAKLFHSTTGKSSAVVRPLPPGQALAKVLSVSEEGDLRRLSFAFLPLQTGAVALHWDKETLFGLQGAFHPPKSATQQQQHLRYFQDGIAAYWDSNNQVSVIEVDGQAVEQPGTRRSPAVVLDCTLVQDCLNAYSFDYSADQIAQALQRLDLSRQAPEADMTNAELDRFNAALLEVWRRDQEILALYARITTSAALGKLNNNSGRCAIIPLVRRGGFSILTNALFSRHIPPELASLAELTEEMDFSSMESLIRSVVVADKALPAQSAMPSLVVMDLAQQLLSLREPSAGEASAAAGTNALFLAHLLLRFAEHTVHLLELICIWFIRARDFSRANRAFALCKHTRLVPVLVRNAFASPRGEAASAAIVLEPSLFGDTRTSSNKQPVCSEEENSFLQWARELRVSAAAATPQQLVGLFAPLDLNLETSITWQLARRPGEVDSLKLVCDQLPPNDHRVLVLHSLALLHEKEYVAAKHGFHRAAHAMLGGGNGRGLLVKYYEAVARLFHRQADISLFFLKLAMLEEGDGNELVREVAFETSLLLVDKSLMCEEAMELIESNSTPAQQSLWLKRLITQLMRENLLALLLQVMTRSFMLHLALRDILLNMAHELDSANFLVAYSFFIRNDLYESASKFAFLHYASALRAPTAAAALDALSLCLSALALLPVREREAGVEINGEVIALRELKQLLAFLSAKHQFAAPLSSGVTPAELFDKMLDQLPTRHFSEAYCAAAFNLAKLWHFPIEAVFDRLPPGRGRGALARRLLQSGLLAASRAEQVHLALHLLSNNEEEEEEENTAAWVSLFQEWRSLSLLVEMLSSKLGLWLRATETAARYVDELCRHELCFPVLARLVERAERFALHTEEAEYVRDVRTAHDAQALQKAAQVLRAKLGN